MSDFIDGIFDHLNPDDFARETSALETIDRDGSAGEAAFNAFVNEQVRALRLAYSAAHGTIDPIIILVSPTVQQLFRPDDDESLGDFVVRVRREAKLINAIWTFIAKKTLVIPIAVTQENEEANSYDLNDKEFVQDLLAKGLMVPGMVFYADRHEGAVRKHRTGTIEQAASGLLGQAQENEQPIPLFDLILDD